MFYNDKKQRDATLPSCTSSLDLFKILYPKCFKHWPYAVAHEMSCLRFSPEFSLVTDRTNYKNFNFEFILPNNKISWVRLCKPVIQWNGRLIFEDDLRSGGLLCFTTQWSSVYTGLADIMVTLGGSRDVEISTLHAGYIPQHKVTSVSVSGSLGFIMDFHRMRSVKGWLIVYQDGNYLYPGHYSHLLIAVCDDFAFGAGTLLGTGPECGK